MDLGDLMCAMKKLDKIDYESWIIWKIDIENILGFRELDSALREEEPSKPTDTSSPEEKAKYENWERSNRFCSTLMECKMAESIYLSLCLKTNSGNAKQIFAALKEEVLDIERIQAPEMLKKLVNIRYDGQGDVMKHLNEMEILARRLKAVDVVIPEDLINQLAVDSLPSQFDPIRLSYIFGKPKWRFIDIIVKCRDFETYVLNKAGNVNNSNDRRERNQANKRRKVKCYSCGKIGHFARDCSMASTMMSKSSW